MTKEREKKVKKEKSQKRKKSKRRVNAKKAQSEDHDPNSFVEKHFKKIIVIASVCVGLAIYYTRSVDSENVEPEIAELKKEIENTTAGSYREDFCTSKLRDSVDSIKKIKLLYENGADHTHLMGSTLLHTTVDSGSLKVAEFLIHQKKIHVDIKDMQRKTPLHTACAQGKLPFVKFFIKNGANKNAQDQSKYTPLHYAAQRGDINMVKFLIKKKAETDVSSTFNKTPLDLASFYGHIDMVKFLIEKKVNIGQTYTSRKTPLHYACMRGHLEIVKVLVATTGNDKAYLNKKDDKGKRAFDYIDKTKHKDIADFMRPLL